jgi:hypothetical protein
MASQKTELLLPATTLINSGLVDQTNKNKTFTAVYFCAFRPDLMVEHV